MGLEGRPGIDAALIQLEQDILNFLTYESSGKLPDVGDRFLWGATAKPPKIPPAFLLYRKLRLYAGQFAALPFTEPGGYYDQPYLTSKALEACMKAELQFIPPEPSTSEPPSEG